MWEKLGNSALYQAGTRKHGLSLEPRYGKRMRGKDLITDDLESVPGTVVQVILGAIGSDSMNN